MDTAGVGTSHTCRKRAWLPAGGEGGVKVIGWQRVRIKSDQLDRRVEGSGEVAG